MKRLSFLLMLVMLVACGPANGNRRADMEAVRQALITFNNAFREGDLQALDSLTTDDYLHTNGNNRAFDKESWFNYLEGRSKQLSLGTLEITEYELIESEIKLHGSSAIVTGLVITAGRRDGETFTRQFRISNVWVKQDGIWKRAAFHDTPVK